MRWGGRREMSNWLQNYLFVSWMSMQEKNHGFILVSLGIMASCWTSCFSGCGQSLIFQKKKPRQIPRSETMLITKGAENFSVRLVKKECLWPVVCQIILKAKDSMRRELFVHYWAHSCVSSVFITFMGLSSGFIESKKGNCMESQIQFWIKIRCIWINQINWGYLQCGYVLSRSLKPPMVDLSFQ